MKAICLGCKLEFEKTNARKKYCGDKFTKGTCSYKNRTGHNWNKKEKVIKKHFCLVCESEIEKSYSGNVPYYRKYCDSCRTRSDKKPLSNKVKIPKVVIKKERKKYFCKHCHLEIPNKEKIYSHPKYCETCKISKSYKVYKPKVKRIRVRKYIPRIIRSDKPWLQPDVFYISKAQMKRIPKMIKIERCNYCRAELSIGTELKWREKGYCSEWCHEMEHLPEVKHVCKRCGIATERTRNEDGTLSRSWRTLCDSCYLKKFGYPYQNKNLKYRE